MSQDDDDLNLFSYNEASPFKVSCSPIKKVNGGASTHSFYGGRKSSTPKNLFPIFLKGAKTTPVRPTDSGKKSSTPGRKRKAQTSPASQGLLNKNRKRRLPFVESNKQYAIDAGQWDFDGTTCKECRMVYTKGEVTDEKTHAEYHSLYTKAIKWSKWKNERCWAIHEVCGPDGRIQSVQKIIAILPSDPKAWLNKLDSLFTLSDRELGINCSLFDSQKDTSVYLVLVTRNVSPLSDCQNTKGSTPKSSANSRVNQEEKVAGFLAAEGITEASRLSCENPLSVATVNEPAEVVISRLWIHHQFRRQGIATKLIDTLRGNFMSKIKSPPQDRILRRDEIAFSDPTIDGLPFAKKYTGQDKFLIYQPQ